MIVAIPISTPQMTVMVYGIVLTGDIPKLDLIENAMPIVITNRPKMYEM